MNMAECAAAAENKSVNPPEAYCVKIRRKLVIGPRNFSPTSSNGFQFSQILSIGFLC